MGRDRAVQVGTFAAVDSTRLTKDSIFFTAPGAQNTNMNTPNRASNAGPGERHGCQHTDTRVEVTHRTVRIETTVCRGCGAQLNADGDEWIPLPAYVGRSK